MAVFVLAVVGGTAFFMLKKKKASTNGSAPGSDSTNNRTTFTVTDNGHTTIDRLIYWSQNSSNDHLVPDGALDVINQLSPDEADVVFAALIHVSTPGSGPYPPDLDAQYHAITKKYGLEILG